MKNKEVSNVIIKIINLRYEDTKRIPKTTLDIYDSLKRLEKWDTILDKLKELEENPPCLY